MSKIVFLGDPHLTARSPISRKETPEEYRKLILDKLNSVKEICIQTGATNLIILGDLFNNNSGLLNEYEADIWETLYDFKKNGIEVYSIIGNHDLNFNNPNQMKGTYIYKTFLTKAVKHLDELKIDDVYIKGVDFGKDFNQTEEYSRYSICVAHCFYENEKFGGVGNGNLTDDKCIELGYQAYVLGHDHVPYDFVNKNGHIIVRPGALMRGTSKTCNLYRTVQIALFDTKLLSWEYKVIPTKPGVEVFNDRVVMEKELDIDVNVKDLLSKFEASQGNDIYEIIDNRKENDSKTIEDYNKIISLITQYLESAGVYRRVNNNDN